MILDSHSGTRHILWEALVYQSHHERRSARCVAACPTQLQPSRPHRILARGYIVPASRRLQAREGQLHHHRHEASILLLLILLLYIRTYQYEVPGTYHTYDRILIIIVYHTGASTASFLLSTTSEYRIGPVGSFGFQSTRVPRHVLLFYYCYSLYTAVSTTVSTYIYVVANPSFFHV